MPSFTTAVEATSPMLVYSANWQAGNSADTAADEYTLSSFAVTQAKGATMAFSFYGTSVTIFGARRDNHGGYQVQIDSNPSSPFSGQSNTAEFNQVMFTSSVPLGVHNVTVTNGDNKFFDIDYLTFQTNVGKDDEQLIVNTYQDTHPTFTYTPSSSWRAPSMVETFSGSSGQCVICEPIYSTLHYFFSHAVQPRTRDAVALYGPVGPNATSHYSVKVDGGNAQFFSANNQFYKPQEMLFYVGNLGAGQHSLQLGLDSSSTQGELAIDYANVYTTPSLGGSFLGPGSASSNTTSQLPASAIAGLAITTTIAILASLGCLYLFWRQRHELFHYYPNRVPKVYEQSLKSAEPFFLSPALESNVGSIRSVGSSQATTDFSGPVSNVAAPSISTRSSMTYTPPVTVGLHGF
ncbi:hypothetical protein GALMADRAFT_1332029 [Galerina marginata CBS 339.88]|uniref:Transmembrane protein n=1 Tax=Galerina marginata (strain CBS 339.88) TaxID=685588 RepID=A0A067T523_GALM3|nr:hypothetical protein GALMADRAFT_1332029 [Galerina marginata CBS 339.88]